MLYAISHEFKDSEHQHRPAGVYKLNLGGTYLCFMQTQKAGNVEGLFCVDRDFFNSEFVLFMDDRK